MPSPETFRVKGLPAGSPVFENSYRCPNCGREWEDHWDCGVDDECGACGTTNISPVESKEVGVAE